MMPLFSMMSCLAEQLPHRVFGWRTLQMLNDNPVSWLTLSR